MTSRRKLASVASMLALLAGTAGVVAWSGAAYAAVTAHDHGDSHDDDDKDKEKDKDSESESASSDHTTHEEHGMAIHDSTGGREPTDEDEENAEELYDAVVEGIAQYEDLDVAIDDGYLEGENSEGLAVKHYMKRGVNGAELDPEQPSGLVYYVDENQATLIGAVWRTEENDPPQPGGPLTVWHDHSPMGCPEEHPDCPIVTGEETDGVPPLMFHVWTFEDAVDVFAHGFPDAVGAEGGRNAEGERPRLPFDV